MKNYQKLKSIHHFFIIVLMIFISAASISAQKRKAGDWAGAYTFFDAPRNSSPATRGTDSYSLTPGVEYNLTIKKTGGNFSATLEINGMQQFERYECSAKADGGGDKLNFYFLSDVTPDDGQRNTQNFKKGALLFSLMKIKTGAKTKYEFQPASFKLARFSSKAKNQPIYFQKTN